MRSWKRGRRFGAGLRSNRWVMYDVFPTAVDRASSQVGNSGTSHMLPSDRKIGPYPLTSSRDPPVPVTMFPSNIGSDTLPTAILKRRRAQFVRRHQTNRNITASNRAAGASTALLLAGALAVLFLATVAGTAQHNFKNDVLLDLSAYVTPRLYG
jgi:hypothetical protein